MKGQSKIDLIITDFTQKSHNGYVFALNVRNLELKVGLHIPILLLSLLSVKDNTLISKGLEEKIFDMYLPKCIEPHEVVNAVSFLINYYPWNLQ